MEEFPIEVVDNIALGCIKMYNMIPKIYNLLPNEWTVMSCILQIDSVTKRYKTISIGTGSKCIGATKMSPEGIKLNDSHAEVIARRGFLLYLYENIEMLIAGKSLPEAIFVRENGRFKLKDNIEFIFYSSQMPCGDASITPKLNDTDIGHILCSRKREADGNDNDVECKKSKSDIDDIHRTGAKCLPQNEQDSKEPGTKYHLLGQVRTKPGLGDRTLSMSCSDKIARWIHVGIQGALLDMLLTKPIYIKHFIFGGGTPYSKESLKRAFLNRNGDELFDIPVIPKIYQTTAVYPYTKSEQRPHAAPASVLSVIFGIIEVTAKGKKLGVTKKMDKVKRTAMSISKYYIYRSFLNLLEKDQSLREEFADGPLDSIPYNVMKRKSQRYYDNWNKVRDNFFKSWTVKPDMWSFCITKEELAANAVDLKKRAVGPILEKLLPKFK